MTATSKDTQDHKFRTLSEMNRILIGAIGGVFVGVFTYPIPAYKALVTDPDMTVTIIGWIIRIIGSFVIGGLWVYLHEEEHNRMKVFQLGIVGPAMISALISANVGRESTRSIVSYLTPYISFISEASARDINLIDNEVSQNVGTKIVNGITGNINIGKNYNNSSSDLTINSYAKEKEKNVIQMIDKNSIGYGEAIISGGKITNNSGSVTVNGGTITIPNAIINPQHGSQGVIQAIPSR